MKHCIDLQVMDSFYWNLSSTFFRLKICEVELSVLTNFDNISKHFSFAHEMMVSAVQVVRMVQNS